MVEIPVNHIISDAFHRKSVNVGLLVVFVLLLLWGVDYSAGQIDYIWRWSIVPEYLAYRAEEGGFLGWAMGPLTEGLLMTLQTSVYSTLIAIVIGLFTGIFRISSVPVLRWISTAYVELIRGTPLLVQIFIFYFFVGTVLDLSRMMAGVAALAFFAGAYVGEIVRAGIQSINRGQMEAARSLGMNYIKAMRYVVLPQAFRRILPPLAGQFISLIKDSSLLSAIALTELAKAGREVVTVSFASFEVWFTVAGMYLVLTFSLSMLIQWMERRFGVGVR